MERGDLLTAVAVWLAAFAVYLGCLPGTFYFEDSPELMTCSWILGNTHPPGYPLLCCLGRIAMLVPVGNPAFRFNVFNAGLAAAALALFGWIAFRLASTAAGVRAAGFCALACTVTWGLSDTFWWQSLIGDKYPLFYLCFVAGLAMAFGSGYAVPRWLLGWALLVGVSFAHHQYSLFALPLLLVALPPLAALRGARAARLLVLGVVLVLLPYSTKLLYPPIRAAAHAEMNWDDPATAPRLVRYSSAARFHGTFASTTFLRQPAVLRSRLVQMWDSMTDELTWPAVAAAVLGFVWLAGRPDLRLPAAAAAGSLVLCLLFCVNYPEKSVRWTEPAYAVVLLFAAVGLSRLLALLARPRRRWAVIVTVLILLAAPVSQARRGRSRNDLARFYAAHDLGCNVLRSMPPNAVYLGAGDVDLFPVWYLLLVENRRDDTDAVGLASFVDRYGADAGMRRRILAAVGQEKATGVQALAIVLRSRIRRPVFIAAGGYNPEVWPAVGPLVVFNFRGLVGRVTAEWDCLASWRETLEVARGYTWRGLLDHRAGAVFDLVRLRDEIARDGFLRYADCQLALGDQLRNCGAAAECASVYGRARRLLEPLAGGPLVARGESAAAQRQALNEGYGRLAAAFAARGVDTLAGIYGSKVR